MTSRWLIKYLYDNKIQVKDKILTAPCTNQVDDVYRIFQWDNYSCVRSDLLLEYPQITINFTHPIFISKYRLQTSQSLRYLKKWILEGLTYDYKYEKISDVNEPLCDMSFTGNHNCDHLSTKDFDLVQGLYRSLNLRMVDKDSYNTWELSLTGFDIYSTIMPSIRNTVNCRNNHNKMYLFCLLIANI